MYGLGTGRRHAWYGHFAVWRMQGRVDLSEYSALPREHVKATTSTQQIQHADMR
jgi:hypothetical protein